MPSGPSPSEKQTQRLDKWLWFARIVKTRTLAASLIESGKVRLNKEKVSKPSQVVRPDDVITLTVARRVRILQVIAAGVRRGPAPEAQKLYEDLTPQAARSHQTQNPHASLAGASHPSAHREPGQGRPTKRERRQLDRFLSQRDDG